jgi:hypothetical protein
MSVFGCVSIWKWKYLANSTTSLSGYPQDFHLQNPSLKFLLLQLMRLRSRPPNECHGATHCSSHLIV